MSVANHKKYGGIKMNRIEIFKLFQDLSMSQGFYGRILDSIDSMDDDQRAAFWDAMESQDFQDPVDVILFMEG